MRRTFILCISILSFSCVQGWPFFFSREEQLPPIGKRSKSIIVLDPAGHAQQPGREIDDSFERSITMQCAQAVKTALEKKQAKVQVVLSRFPGETIEPLQTVSFANRVAADLYISINFFEQQEETPNIFLYTLMFDPATDFVQKCGDELLLLPYDQSYKLSLKKTKELVNIVYTSCQAAARRSSLRCRPPLSVPFKPLLGVIAPALGIEVGIRRHTQWKLLVPIIVQSLERMITL